MWLLGRLLGCLGRLSGQAVARVFWAVSRVVAKGFLAVAMAVARVFWVVARAVARVL